MCYSVLLLLQERTFVHPWQHCLTPNLAVVYLRRPTHMPQISAPASFGKFVTGQPAWDWMPPEPEIYYIGVCEVCCMQSNPTSANSAAHPVCVMPTA